MKKPKASPEVHESEMRTEYDFRGGVRGKYAARFRQRSIAVVLDPDVAQVFGNAEAVNSALRALAEIVGRQNTRRTRMTKNRGSKESNAALQPPGSARG